MPVQEESSKVILNANGTQTAFSFSFKIFKKENINVYEVQTDGTETLKTEGTDYTFSSDDLELGGTVTFGTAPASGKKVLIIRSIPLEQDADFRPVSGFPEEVITDSFDTSRMIDQDLQEQLNRCVKLRASSTANTDTLREKVERVYESVDNIDAVADNEANINAVNSNKTNINAVAGDLTNINSVAGDLTNIDAVNANKTNIDAVVGNATNINTVAGISSNVTTVAGISAAVTAVNNNATNINAVNANKTNIDAVANDKTNIDAVADNLTNINAVNNNKTNIDAVADNETDISTVAAISTDVTTVATNISEVMAVSDNETNINTVASNISNVNSVGGNISNVNAVANNATNINAVNSNKTNIDTVATNSSNITTCATNISEITSASAYAAQAKQYAIGDPTEPTSGHSAKWYSEHLGLTYKGDYSSSVTYDNNDYVRSVGETTTTFYNSIQGNNSGHALTETAWWSIMWSVQSGGGGGTVTDVQVNGVSVVSGGVGNIPKATNSVLGAVKTDNTTIQAASDGTLTAKTLDGLTATVSELNYTDGVTSSIQTQLDSKQDTATYDSTNERLVL